MKTFFRFRCQETESAYQDQRIPFVSRHAATLLLFKAFLTVSYLIVALVTGGTRDEYGLPTWNVVVGVVPNLLAAPLVLTLFLRKDWVRRHWVCWKVTLVVLMCIDVGRLIVAQCIRTAAAPHFEAYTALSFFYPAAFRVWTFRWALVLNSVALCAALAPLCFRAHTVGQPLTDAGLYLFSCGLGLLLVYLQVSPNPNQEQR